jgi:SAM-dependent methyltransferase
VQLTYAWGPAEFALRVLPLRRLAVGQRLRRAKPARQDRGVAGQPDFDLTYDKLIFDPVLRDYFGPDGYYNAGYWDTETKDSGDASRTLTDRLIEQIPSSAKVIADVGCGLGATTLRICQMRPKARVLAINFSLAQLQICRTVCPAAEVLQMDAARLGLASCSLDAIISVEAALHFHTRVDFLNECTRTLRPGGVLSLSDILLSRAGCPLSFTVPEENFLKDRDDYYAILRGAGFKDINIESVTDHCWGGFCRNLERWSQDNPAFDEIQRNWWRMHIADLHKGVTNYLSISAVKPRLSDSPGRAYPRSLASGARKDFYQTKAACFSAV